jgi:hypothetical protein
MQASLGYTGMANAAVDVRVGVELRRVLERG